MVDTCSVCCLNKGNKVNQLIKEENKSGQPREQRTSSSQPTQAVLSADMDWLHHAALNIRHHLSLSGGTG